MSQQPTTLWHRGLTFKLLQFLSDRHMVRMIMEMVVNRSFTLITGKSICSRLRTLKNGVPQGSVLAPLLFNIYISDLTNTVYRKYTYTDDLAIMHADGNCQAVEGVMTKDTETVNEYLQTWKLMLGTTKTVSALGSFPPQQQGRVREPPTTTKPCPSAKSHPQQQNPALLLRTQIPRSNVGQVVHVSATP